MAPPSVSSIPDKDAKLPLQQWLKLWTDRGVDMRVAMGMAAKMYKTHQTPLSLSKFTSKSLDPFVSEKEAKKAVMAGIKSLKADLAGGIVKNERAETSERRKRRDPQHDLSLSPSLSPSPSAGDSKPSTSKSPTKKPARPKKRRKYNDDGTAVVDEELVDDFDFKEVWEIEELRQMSCQTNRAPCMTAWAYIIAEKMGFERVEALSLASVFTSITSTHHALALGNVYDDKQRKDAELEVSFVPGGGKRKGMKTTDEEEREGGYTQPWVSLMGRKPVIQLASGKWAGLSKGIPVGPEKAYSYITRNFREITPHVIGALRLLARCYSVEELNDRGYGFYVAFRPEVQGWGDKGTLYVSNIIDMIPPEAEADLAIYPVLDGEGSREVNEALSAVPPPVEQSHPPIQSEDVIRKLADGDAPFRPAVATNDEIKLEPGVGLSAKVNSATERGDVFEGFFEADWDDDIDQDNRN